jgi:hypothetical protein
MWLFPNKKMDGLPMDVRFVVQMETAEGLTKKALRMKKE